MDTVKWLVSLNGFKYCNLTLTIQFNINYLFVHSQIVKQFDLTY